MAFRKQVLSQLTSSYDNFSEHYKDVRAFFEIIKVRFSIEEYGVKLACIDGNRLFSNTNGYMLSDDSSYPFYLWQPSWLGRFYVDAARVPAGVAADDCRSQDVGPIGFIWTWMGFNDAYVNDAGQPECWFGVADPRPDNPAERMYDVASTIWKFFRVERTCEGESDGWLTGHFLKNDIGCNLNGHWHMRRVPLSELSSFYQVEKCVVRPLGEKFAELAARAVVPLVPAVAPASNGHTQRVGADAATSLVVAADLARPGLHR
jgi:hypothetical protein